MLSALTEDGPQTPMRSAPSLTSFLLCAARNIYGSDGGAAHAGHGAGARRKAARRGPWAPQLLHFLDFSAVSRQELCQVHVRKHLVCRREVICGGPSSLEARSGMCQGHTSHFHSTVVPGLIHAPRLSCAWDSFLRFTSAFARPVVGGGGGSRSAGC